ncbi:CaiB/BaiF CoA-transferase family protein [Nakamurella leprariae]|uniref:CoA transferase n=1 Tax=Nakamurella leprariae TaxID=2803911 RepID=A0A938YBA1_9ACTN|nr:CoA transferase [Nakamurella leprariae]MBM9466431.1 CoA transferase [Nakamurella leprariae]
MTQPPSADRAAPRGGPDLPLTGLRIVDAVDGPLQGATRILADLGAEVIRIEPPAGSSARGTGMVVDGHDVTFALRNANKVGGTADLDDPADLARLHQVLATADVFVHDDPPAAAHARGLDPDSLRALNAELVTVSLRDFGAAGPRSGWLGTADVHAALSTVLSRSGLPEVPSPLLPPEFLAYQAASAQAAWVIMLAFWHAARTGQGDFADFSVSEALIQILDPGLGSAGSARAGRPGLDLPRGRPDARHLYPIFPAADGWVRFCVLSARQWRGMFRWLGEPAEFADPKYDNGVIRFGAADRLYPLIGAMVAPLTRAEAVEQGQAFGVPTAALLSVQEVLETDAYRESGSFTTTELEPGLTVTAPTGLYELDGVHLDIRRPAPTVGTPLPSPDRATRLTAPAATAGTRPFEGLRVLDLGVIVVGAELGRLFADHGADVIKIESTAFPDGSRQAHDGSQMTHGFAWGHRNKRSLGLDLRSERGRALFTRLVEQADVVLTNFKPGTLAKLGFDLEALTAINPRIVLSESSAFGNVGPWSRRMGYGPLVRASAGLSLQWRYPDIEGSFSDAITIFPDHVVGRLNAIAVTALLLRRERTGRGGQVGTAQVDAIFNAMGDRLVAESVQPGTIRAEGNDRLLDAPRGIVPAAGDDDWVVVDVRGDDQFAAVARTIGRPEWLTDPSLATAAGRVQARDRLRAELAAWTATRPAVEAAEILQTAGIPAGNLVRVPDLLTDDHLAVRQAFDRLPQPQFADPLPTHGAEARFREVPVPEWRAAPVQGEHTREIATDLLGLGDDEIDTLLTDGTLEESFIQPVAAR